MIAPTHIVFSVLLGTTLGAPAWWLKWLAIGSLLPDLDQPQSIVGKMVYPISSRINKLFGHRGMMHSMLVWLPLTIIGLKYFKPLGILSIGAITHGLIDCLTITGVQLFAPFSEKIFVLANKRFRFRSSSRQEMMFLAVLCLLLWGAALLHARGGMRKLLVDVSGSYELVREAYERRGMEECNFIGKIRLPDGMIIENEWLIVGTEDPNGLALYDRKEKRILHVPHDGKPLRAKLIATGKHWQSVKLARTGEIASGDVFFKIQGRWARAWDGMTVLGHVVYQTGESVEIRPTT